MYNSSDFDRKPDFDEYPSNKHTVFESDEDYSDSFRNSDDILNTNENGDFSFLSKPDKPKSKPYTRAEKERIERLRRLGPFLTIISSTAAYYYLFISDSEMFFQAGYPGFLAVMAILGGFFGFLRFNKTSSSSYYEKLSNVELTSCFAFSIAGYAILTAVIAHTINVKFDFSPIENKECSIYKVRIVKIRVGGKYSRRYREVPIMEVETWIKNDHSRVRQIDISDRGGIGGVPHKGKVYMPVKSGGLGFSYVVKNKDFLRLVPEKKNKKEDATLKGSYRKKK